MEAGHQPNAFTWIGLYEPTEEEFESIRSEFGLHPLAVEDAIEAHERPKLEVYADMILIVLKTARYVDPKEVIELGEILVFLGHDYIITVRHGEASELSPVRRQLEEQPELLKHGPGAVLLLPHDLLDLLEHAKSERQPGVDPRGFLSDQSGPQHQAMRDNLRLFRGLAQDREEVAG